MDPIFGNQLDSFSPVHIHFHDCFPVNEKGLYIDKQLFSQGH